MDEIWSTVKSRVGYVWSHWFIGMHSVVDKLFCANQYLAKITGSRHHNRSPSGFKFNAFNCINYTKKILGC